MPARSSLRRLLTLARVDAAPLKRPDWGPDERIERACPGAVLAGAVILEALVVVSRLVIAETLCGPAGAEWREDTLGVVPVEPPPSTRSTRRGAYWLGST